MYNTWAAEQSDPVPLAELVTLLPRPANDLRVLHAQKLRKLLYEGTEQASGLVFSAAPNRFTPSL